MSGKPRIGVAGLLHESNTFIARPTTREDFAANCLDFGELVGQRWRGSHHEVGGFLQGAAACGFEPVPILLAIAVPAGPLVRRVPGHEVPWSAEPYFWAVRPHRRALK